jgi:hypothetical protein
MKSLWSIVSFLAVAHMLALLMFVGWLWQSNRLDAQRLSTVRELFAMTIPDAARAADAAREAELAEAEAALAEQRRIAPPVSSAARINHMSQLEEIEQRTLRRIEQEKTALRDQLTAGLARLDEREVALQQEHEAWEQSIQTQRERRESEQFAKTVRQYEAVRPRQGKEMLMELIKDGEMLQAVAYLDAMNARASSRILGEFKTPEEIRLATELLEQLRMFGIPDDSQDASNAETFADAR